MSDTGEAFSHLGGTGRGLARLVSRPAMLVQAALAGALLLSWGLLVWMAASASVQQAVAAGPGMAILEALPLPDMPATARLFLGLCLTPAAQFADDLTRLAALTAMWFLMAVAMMLPSAAPMIRTYCEIADTACGRSRKVVHPVVFVSGYLAVWLASAFVFAASTVVLQRLAGDGPLTGWAGAGALAAAGAWQFSPLKEACLKKCRAPFAALFARWSTASGGVFRLGAEQGVWCLGCCWALMLVMFVVGTMNVFWMALIGTFAVVEKREASRWPARIAGAILLVWALALLVVSLQN